MSVIDRSAGKDRSRKLESSRLWVGGRSGVEWSRVMKFVSGCGEWKKIDLEGGEGRGGHIQPRPYGHGILPCYAVHATRCAFPLGSELQSRYHYGIGTNTNSTGGKRGRMCEF